MALGSLDFPSHLSAASIVGVVYGSELSDEVNQIVPTISLVAQQGDELAKAFETFNVWSKTSDPDSVEITFVFRKSGGYVLAISAEYSRLERRCLGFDRTHKPMAITATWFKPIDSVHPLLLRFRKHCSAPIAPFRFGGVVYTGLRGLLKDSSPSDLGRIPGLEPLLKFDVTFIDEDEVIPHTLGWQALNIGSRPVSNSPKGPPRPEPRDVVKQRVKTIAYHFPVTLERMRRSPNIRDLMRQLGGEGVSAWQIEQALCNLVLNGEMSRSAHYVGLSGRKADSSILDALRSRCELASGGDVPTFSVEEVRTQVGADGNALLRYLGKKSAKDLAAIQVALRSVSALEAPTAVADPPAEWRVT
jgi:hypothetical protein